MTTRCRRRLPAVIVFWARKQTGAGGQTTGAGPRHQSADWSATKEATQASAEFQLTVNSFVDHDWMSSM
jgi:hypothetical protein